MLGACGRINYDPLDQATASSLDSGITEPGITDAGGADGAALPAGSFTISLDQPSLQFNAGTTGEIGVEVLALDGFNQMVDLSVTITMEGAPWTTASLSVTGGSLPLSSVLSVTPDTLRWGAFEVEVAGVEVDGSETAVATVRTTILPTSEIALAGAMQDGLSMSYYFGSRRAPAEFVGLIVEHTTFDPGPGPFNVLWDFGDGPVEVDQRAFEPDPTLGGFTIWSTRVHSYADPGSVGGTVTGVNAAGGFGRTLE